MERWHKFYIDLAVQGFNFFVLFVAANIILIFVNKALERHPAPAPAPTTVAAAPPVAAVPHDPDKGRPRANKLRDHDTMDWVDMEAFNGVDPDEVEAVLDEFNLVARRGYVYEPWVQFAPPPYNGKYVNVDAPDPEFICRRSVLDKKLSPPGAPKLKVFVLGGSTIYGSRLADEWTLPSYLGNELQQRAGGRVTVEMTNYGRPWYYSSQEVLLLERLIRAGKKPDVVVFVDGLNDCMNWFNLGLDRPSFTDKMSELYYLNQFGKDWLSQYSWIPIVKFAFFARHGAFWSKPVVTSQQPHDDATANTCVDRVLSTYKENMRLARLICQEYGIRCYFVWQPCPFYRYDPNLHRRFPEVGQWLKAVFDRSYEKVAAAAPGCIDLGASIEEYGKDRKVFVDDVHYGPAFVKFLAHKMADSIDVDPSSVSIDR